MKSFGEYISFWAITDVLISKRVQLADKLHKKHQLHLLSPNMALGELKESERILMSLMPPRKSWISLSRNTRFRDVGEGHRQRIATTRCNWQSIKWTIKRDKAKDSMLPYLEKLNEFVVKVQTRVRDKSFAIAEPELFPEIKDESSCRPLCKFEQLEDAVILILANKYLTELFDGVFYNESLAFRSKRMYHGKECVTTHHHAITRMKEFRSRYERKPLYVCECDLQKFYDTVSHQIVRKSYYDLLNKIRKGHSGLDITEISRVFEAYLRCYSFPRSVYKKNGDQEFWERNHIEVKQRRFKWVEKELLTHKIAKSHRGLMKMGIGVPQGGSLSGLIANLVLNTVDWQVKKQMKKGDLYLRYCDDMIIISTCKSRCKRLFSIYSNGAIKLRLVPHLPKAFEYGKKSFWEGKSKDAYLWEMGREDASEWIGFVGYEMRRDGMLRIRKKSFRKELDKQINVVFVKTLDRIKNENRVSNDSLLNSLESRLISMSVGKIAVWNAPFFDSEMCWSAGFKELEMNPVLAKQLRELDRHRWMMLGAARRRLGNKMKGELVTRRDLEQSENDNYHDSSGMVHSYYYQFAK